MAGPFHLHEVVLALNKLDEHPTKKEAVVAVFQYLISFGTKKVQLTDTDIESLELVETKDSDALMPVFSHFGLPCLQQGKSDSLLKASLQVLCHKEMNLNGGSYTILADVLYTDRQPQPEKVKFEVLFEPSFWEMLII